MQERVKHLFVKVKELTIENESLKAEVELYRAGGNGAEAAALGAPSSGAHDDNNSLTACDDFLKSGNGVYAGNSNTSVATDADVITLKNIHGNSNSLCCALSHDDTMLASGGADCHLSLLAWGAADNGGPASDKTVAAAQRVRCDGPVIAVAFSTSSTKLVAAGSMDGNVWVHAYELVTGQGLKITASSKIPTKHGKYVKKVAWNSAGLLASASADGTVQVHKVTLDVDYTKDDDSAHQLTVKSLEKLHLSGAVEAMCFVQDQYLVCYAREKPYLLVFDSQEEFAIRKINLNSGGRPAAAGTSMEDQHVSFAVMDIAASPNNQHKYLALATDSSRNIIVAFDTGLQVRNLYGHQNDGFSNPKIAWSHNGQYLLGNTQEDASICVWDIASSQLVARIGGSVSGDAKSNGHGQTVRDMFASATTDTLVTTSFDKQTKLWFAAV